MSVATIDATTGARLDAGSSVADSFTTPGGAMLNELLVDAWERLAARGVVECPLCGGTLEVEREPGASALSGRCSGCRSVLE